MFFYNCSFTMFFILIYFIFLFNCSEIINFKTMGTYYIYSNIYVNITKFNYVMYIHIYNKCIKLFDNLFITYYMFNFVLLIYIYGYSINLLNLSLGITNTSFYLILLIFLLFMFIWLAKDTIFSNFNNTADIHQILNIVLFNICIYFIVQHVILLLFLIECQGIIIFFLIFNRQLIKLNYYKINLTNLFSYIRITQLNQYSAIFIQYWVAFSTVICFVFFIMRMLIFSGLVLFSDWIYFTYFFCVYYINYLNTIYYGICFFCLLVYLIKFGIFPFYFWKPLFYRGLGLWYMLWYMLIPTCLFILILPFILIFTLFNLQYFYYKIVYFLIIITILIMLSIIFILVEIRIFLTYLSLYHMTYLFTYFFFSKYNLFLIITYYLVIYIVTMLILFSLILWLDMGEIKFLTDLQRYISNSTIGRFFLFILFVMGGLPPFAGFWSKILILLELINNNEILLMSLFSIISFTLLYFYLQNYRFFNSNIFSWDYNYFIKLKLRQIIWYIYIYIMLCILSFFFFWLNDILTYNYFLNSILVYNGYL